MAQADDDRLVIRDLVENWAVWRDALDWKRFATVWHEGGRMQATWWQGSFEDFIQVSQEGFDRGVRILHFLGGASIDVAGNRAIAQTKMTITQRVEVHGVLCDVICTGRFYDFFERRRPAAAESGPADGVVALETGGPGIGVQPGREYGGPGARPGASGRWGMVLRQPIYEQDRMLTVSPTDAPPRLDQELLGRFPEGYRHLAYIQTLVGYDVKRDMPGLTGPEVEQLYSEGAAWLAGGPVPTR